ncbi:peptide ABC transporter ATP-binding protein [Alkalispirochaeta sphaeroplastigenens]|uniref:Peptide ABC transporter ATP-binding protein n=1 Tax=Alkalispirochaeta sphaeroplastigenens TaxID=1187066 RepID=A0A2S4JSW2_9SPIO|nr:ABC transporter ATP-binding protein [Alkalispirochaeta sphaeroplastigenens]POR02629.1 peptide ABC transporter ATP-binding protein [Alkalispirochaeta sphaeroplastigenens]
MTMLDVQNLSVEYKIQGGVLRAVDGVSFTLKRAESLGIVGESGCGKSTIAKALLQLLPKNGKISGGHVFFDGDDLVGKSAEEIRKMRQKRIALVSQSAMNSLNPVHTVGKQIIEAIRCHSRMSVKEAYARAVEVFSMVGLEEKRLRSFPHQLSGGMKQRAIIAMALSLEPDIIIADEPTTALDVVVQGRILQRIQKIHKEISSSMIFITHDISVVSEVCETIMVMYGGRVMEIADTDSFFRAPYHPYSLGLQNAFPSITEIGQEELVSIPGSPPNLSEPQEGCRFHVRCPFATETCRTEEPPLEKVRDDHYSACWYNDKVESFRREAGKRDTWESVRKRIEEQILREDAHEEIEHEEIKGAGR